MARDKEFWLIPKRANLHQSVVLLKGICELGYVDKAWNAAKQDRLGSYLGKRGATRDGKTITPQSLRTLLASIPQYFGFTFINTDTTPSTLIVTNAGFKLINEFEIFLEEYHYSSLKDAERNSGTIDYSKTYLNQFLKLQITNPVILKDCRNILVFPLLFVLRILKKTRYLTYEELAYFIFNKSGLSEADVLLTVQEIVVFRSLDYSKQDELISLFKETDMGNISLVQAPTTSYFQKLCSYTGLIDGVKKQFLTNSGITTKKTIQLNENRESLIDSILTNHNYKPYDFKDNLGLWCEYIGDPDVVSTPKDINAINNTQDDQLVVISKDGSIVNGDLVKPNSSISFPVIENREYKIDIYSKEDGSILKTYSYEFSNNVRFIDIQDIPGNNDSVIDQAQVEQEILEHIDSKNFSEEYLQYLSVLEKLEGKHYSTHKSLRGGRLEFLFYQYFSYLKDNSVIDDVVWYGKIGQYGLPTSSPGGVQGSPDIILYIDDTLVVVELTTIKPKSMQWTAEGASVPDHIRLVEKDNPGREIFALYLAPIIHEERVTKGMLSRLEGYESKLHCLKIVEFLQYGRSFNSKSDFKSYLKGE